MYELYLYREGSGLEWVCQSGQCNQPYFGGWNAKGKGNIFLRTRKETADIVEKITDSQGKEFVGILQGN